MKTSEHEQTIDGYTVRIDIHQDEDMRAPWEEHDGHGVVSGWGSRDKAPGELVLNSDHRSYRYYDVAATLKIAKRDGWGLSEANKAKLATKLGHKPTRKEITAEAVQHDYEYLRGWCNDEWVWLGYTTEITTPEGKTLDGHSCWGFDEEKYMLSEAIDEAKHAIERHKLTMRETAIAECVP